MGLFFIDWLGWQALKTSDFEVRSNERNDSMPGNKRSILASWSFEKYLRKPCVYLSLKGCVINICKTPPWSCWKLTSLPGIPASIYLQQNKVDPSGKKHGSVAARTLSQRCFKSFISPIPPGAGAGWY